MANFGGKKNTSAIGGFKMFANTPVVWQQKAGRYQAVRDLPNLGIKKNEFIPQTRVTKAVENYRDAMQNDMKKLAGDLKDKKIGYRDFERGMRRLIRSNERVAGVVGAGGAERFGKNKEFSKITERNTREQFRYLSNYVQELRDKGNENMTARDINRAGMYSLTSHRTMYEVMRAALRQDADKLGMKVCEKRVLGQAEHCDDCVEYASRCWQEQGDLPEPTQDSQCGPNCRCEKKFTFIPIEKDCEDVPCGDEGNGGAVQEEQDDDNLTDLSDDSQISEATAWQ